MKAQELLSQHRLDNGLTLEFWELSRPLAGDRWQVVMRARVAVQVNRETVPPELKDRLSEVISSLGPEIAFIKDEVRNFIDASEKPKLLKDIEAQLLSSLRSYLGHQEFAPRLIRRQFAEYQQKRLFQREG